MGRPLVRSAASALDAAVARMPTAAAMDDKEQPAREPPRVERDADERPADKKRCS
jgi:hypothetical protein